MTQAASEEIRQQWKENILKQRESGLSIASWCRQNNLAIHAFFYWRDKLFSSDPLDRTNFIEIPKEKNHTSKTGIILEYQNFKIHLDAQFDTATLKKCLEVLRKC